MFKGLKRKKKAPLTHVTHLFHGIEIVAEAVPGQTCCPAARALNGERFLSDDAPRLPLDECSHPQYCACRYKHFTDRRTDARRDWDVGLPKRGVEHERRGGPGRRITDE